jgi:hypothetical protein
MHFYDQALLPCVVPNREFLRWNAQKQLGNATWEWPKRPVESASSTDWPHDFAERLYHEDPLWAEIKRAKGA